jgi:hypothetical protein
LKKIWGQGAAPRGASHDSAGFKDEIKATVVPGRRAA